MTVIFATSVEFSVSKRTLIYCLKKEKKGASKKCSNGRNMTWYPTLKNIRHVHCPKSAIAAGPKVIWFLKNLLPCLDGWVPSRTWRKQTASNHRPSYSLMTKMQSFTPTKSGPWFFLKAKWGGLISWCHEFGKGLDIDTRKQKQANSAKALSSIAFAEILKKG